MRDKAKPESKLGMHAAERRFIFHERPLAMDVKKSLPGGLDRLRIPKMTLYFDDASVCCEGAGVVCPVTGVKG